MSVEGAGIDWAMATICCDGFGDENFSFAFDEMPKLGVRNVEFNCWYPRNLTPHGLESIRVRSQEAGLLPISIHVTGYAGGVGAEVTREVNRWMWLLEACRRLDVKLLKATAQRRHAGGLDGLIDVLAHIAPVATDMGITLALENHRNNVLEFPSDFERVFNEVTDESVGLCLDTGHFAASGVDILDVVQQFRSRLVHVDLKDCDRVGSDDFVPFGDGNVDFPAILDAVASTGYQGYLLVEYPKRSDEHMAEDLQKGISIASGFVSKARSVREGSK